MPFSKLEMQEELLQFLSLFGKDIARLYGVGDVSWTEKEAILQSPVWKAANDMYDFGVTGTSTEDLYPKGHISGVYGHLERFLRAMDTPQMRLYLKATNNTPPHLTMLAVQSAVARMVLEEGWRENDYGAGEHGWRKGDMNHLTLAELALLANMDERSVRNAANPKLPDPLKTEQVGKRSLVRPEEARRWLAVRKGFIPTADADKKMVQRKPEFNISLNAFYLDALIKEAIEAGIPLEGREFVDYVHKRSIEIMLKEEK